MGAQLCLARLAAYPPFLTSRAPLVLLQVVLGVLGCPNLPQGQVCDEDGGSAAVQRSNDDDVGELCGLCVSDMELVCVGPGSWPGADTLAASKQGGALGPM